MTDLLLDSLRRRVRAMHSLYDDAVDTMDLEGVNHVERDEVLPIAFSLFHFANMEDTAFVLVTGQDPVWDGFWAERLQLAIPDHGKHRPPAEMVAQRIGDYDAFTAYMRTVYARTEAWLAELDPTELTRVVVGHPLPPPLASTYSARVAGPDGITLLDAVECWIYQHGLRHMGEIEHARALIGLQGMTS